MLDRCWTKTRRAEKWAVLHIRSCGYAGPFPQSSWFCMPTRACRTRTLFRVQRRHHVLPADKRQSSSGCVSFGCAAAQFLFFCIVKLVLHAHQGLQDTNAISAATLASRSSCRQTTVEQWSRQLSMRRCPGFFLQTKERSHRAGFAVNRCRASCPSLVNLDRKKG